MFEILLKNKHLKDFLNESVIHGLRLLLYYTPFKYARLLWILFMFAVIVWTHFIITTLIIQYTQQPTEVRMSPRLIHVSDTPFPSVAICSANKFSRMKLKKFAEEIFKEQQLFQPYYLARTTQEMFQYLLYLKGFYVSPYDNEPINLTVAHRLGKIFTFMFNNTEYPIRDYLKFLAPDCEDIVIRGTIYEVPINTTDYIIKRLTSTNACCMFNNNRKDFSINPQFHESENQFARNIKNVTFESNSILNSIQFVLRSDTEDFTYTEFNNLAFRLYIFPPNDYAIIQSNCIGEILVDQNTIVEIPIQPEFFGSSNRVRQFKEHVRHCYFPDEGRKILNQSYYSIDECLHICRMDSMMKYCGCVSPPMVASNKTIKYCDFMDLQCLEKWKKIWYDWNDFEYGQRNDEDFKNDFTTGHKCPHCLPICSGVDYNTNGDVMRLKPTHREFYSHGILKGLTSTKPLSIIKLYFRSRYVQATQKHSAGDWVIFLNRFGGIMGLMYGFSIISYIEIVYFASDKFFASYFEKLILKFQTKLSKKSSVTKPGKTEDDAPPAYNLCWQELKPKQPVDIEIILNLYKKEKF